MKQLLLSLCLLMAALTGCRKEAREIPPDRGGEISVLLSIDLGEGAVNKTRGISDPVNQSHPLTFGEQGYLIFTDDRDSITKTYYILPDASGTGPGNIIPLSAIRQSHEPLELWVPASSARAVFLANLPRGFTIPPVGDYLTALEDPSNVLHFTTQTDGQSFGVEKAALYGKGYIVDNPGIGVAPYKIYLEVRPLISRIEIGALTMSGELLASGSARASVFGIFVNNYPESMSVTGKEVGNVIDHGSDPAKYIPGNSYYETSYTGYHYEWFTENFGPGTYTLTPDSPGKVWGFNVFAHGVPHIVIRLCDVYTKDGTLLTGGYWDGSTYHFFATVRGFVNKSTGEQIMRFEGGKVYHIGEIILDETKLHPMPEPEIYVEVEVTVQDWIKHERFVELQ